MQSLTDNFLLAKISMYMYIVCNYLSIIRVQKELMDQDRKKQEADAARRHAHAEEVRKQVREKEAGKVMQRRAFFDEGIKLDQEARER